MSQCLPKLDAIVTQGWGRIAYNIVRSLGKQGIKVGVGVDRFLGMAAVSRYTTATFQHPSFVDEPAQFLQTVREALIRYAPRVYIPADEEAFLIAKYIDLLNDLGVKIPVAKFDVLKVLHLKHEVTGLATSLGIPTPETIVPRDEREIREFGRQHGWPVVLKLLSSSGARGVFYLNRDDPSPLSETGPLHYVRMGEFLAQSYVRGTGYGVSMLFNSGELRARFTHKRLREKTYSGGISTLRSGVSNPLLEEYAETLLRHVKYHGVAMVEFKYDEATNQAWLIEVNPRFWGSLALAVQSGVDFPYLLYRIALEGDVKPVLTYKTGVCVRWILGDCLAMLDTVRHLGRARLPGKGTFWAQGYDDLYWDDPVPFFVELALALRKRGEERVRKPNQRSAFEKETTGMLESPRFETAGTATTIRSAGDGL
jgi:predicted ATP-grasp superfamily ATP-dependent carboligase